MLSLLLLLAPPQLDPIQVNLSTVTVRQAEKLSGRLVLVTLDLLDNDDRRGGYVVSSNDGPDSDGDEVERAVWAPIGKMLPMKAAALGTIMVLRHAAAVGADGTEFPAWVEVRVVIDP